MSIAIQDVILTSEVPTDRDIALLAGCIESFDHRKRLVAVLRRVEAWDDFLLRLVVEGHEPAGPHLGNFNFDEERLKAIALYELDKREKERQREEKEREIQRLREEATGARCWNVALALLAALVAITSPVLTLWVQARFFPPP